MVVPDKSGTQGSVKPSSPGAVGRPLGDAAAAGNRPAAPKPPKVPEDAVAANVAVKENLGGGNSSYTLKPEVPNGPLINKPLHRLSESTFTEGMDRVTLRRGFLVRLASRAAAPGSKVDPKKTYKFQFLYNPETVQIQSEVFTGITPPEFHNQFDRLQARFPGSESMAFALLLDRTQEAYEEGLGTYGTQKDIEQLYRVINGNNWNPGFLTLSSIAVHFGPTTQNGKPLKPIEAYVNSLTIQHTKFNPRMCPIRSVITLGLTRLVSTEVLSQTASINAQSGVK